LEDERDEKSNFNNKYKLNYIIYYERKVKKGDRG